MANLIERVQKFSAPMFIVFVFSKVLVGIGLGDLLVQYLAPYGWAILIAGVVISLICIVLALKQA